MKYKSTTKNLLRWSASLLLGLLPAFGWTAEVKFCVWDPVGATGPVMTVIKDTKIKAASWGVDMKLLPYTDEKVASNDFRAGACDAVFLTSLLSKDFVPFAGSLDAVGGTQSEAELQTLLASLSTPKASKVLSQNGYEISAIYPVGSVFFFVRDRNLYKVSDFSGKRISVLNGDVSAIKLTDLVGGSPVATTLSTWSGMFNNGNLDVLGSVALAYETFELYNGLGSNGGVIDYRVQYAMMQAVIRQDKFPKDFGAKMRADSFARFKEVQKLVADAEKNIPEKYWIHLDDATRQEYDLLTHNIRLALRKDGEYDYKALKLQWKIRCKFNPTRAECSKFD